MAEYVIPIVATVATVASTAYSVYSSTEVRHEARSEEHLDEGLAAIEAQRAKKAEEDRRRRVLATQRSLYGAAGLEMEGSPLLVQAETIRNSEENLRQIEQNRMFKAKGLALNLEQEEQATYSSAIKAGMKGASSGYSIGRTYNWW